MTRKALVIAVLTVIMGTHLTACSSSSGKDDTSVAESNDETFAEEGEGDFADNSQATAEAAPADGAAAANGTAPTEQAASGDATAKPEDSGADLSLGDGTGTDTAQNGDAGGLPAETPPADSNAAPQADVPAGSDVAASTETPKADDGGLSLDSADALPQDKTENITQNPATPSDAGVFDNKPTDTTSSTVADAGTPPAAAESPAQETPAADVPAESTPEPAAEAKPKRSAKHTSSVASTGSVSYAPLMKVKDASFTGPGGETLNRVYIARPKETAKSIATKVYNDPKRSKDLVKWNPVLKRGARAGDKVYYASAANPSDSAMKNYYDEAGVQPQTYVSKDGDNLRTVASSLLGFKDAWKEVWETNPSVDSKGKIPAGLSITYWPASSTAAPVQTMAANTTSPTDANGGMPTTLPEAAPQVPPQAQAQAQSGQTTAQSNGSDPFAAPPPTAGAQPPAGGQSATGQSATGQAMANNAQGVDPMAPPAPNAASEQAQQQQMAAAAAAGTTGAPPPSDSGSQPPPAAATAPVAKSSKKTAKAEVAADEGGMDSDTTMALGVGGVLLLAAAILFVVIRKNRAKRMDLGQTQV